MTASNQLHAIAILGRKYEPLYIHNFTDKPDLEVQYFLHMSLDFVEDAEASAPAGTGFLGLVFFLENINVYAYRTMSNAKFLVAVRWSGKMPEESSIQQLLESIAQYHDELLCNPFYSMDGFIRGSACGNFMSHIVNLQSSLDEE